MADTGICGTQGRFHPRFARSLGNVKWNELMKRGCWEVEHDQYETAKSLEGCNKRSRIITQKKIQSRLGEVFLWEWNLYGDIS
ncbi:hypothetical protein RUM44_012300 [Polyplax serrata]|uniref:Uncharacterized protein n=1 Tax=Polyplax serrata TaxID=468196 RepID=A0ABR1BES2_POLSC